MSGSKKNPGNLVFGLDIGTRSIVGTVGYKTEDAFHVIAQESKEHDTRSMLDGQIHDIERVGRTIADVKDVLERQIGKQLNEVCIAAAGRVLKTVTTVAEIEYPEETVIDAEEIYTLDMLGVEKAYEEFHESNNTDMKFYSVGYTVVKYAINGYPIATPERHKAKNMSVELIATFLPDDVVDGLYKAVEIADLQVANLTLEPIAAMQAAVPDMYRMLNIALVDVGAGTSDISITRDGSVVAYGMIPKAGDELTEAIAKALLLDFNTAEEVKTKAVLNETITYVDIMGISHTIEPDEVVKITESVIEDMTSDIAAKIIELNADKPVSAVFVVGGGGKIPTFTDELAKKLDILPERCALRGKEVLKDIDYQIENPVIDSMYVTPIGICLNFYDQKNNFIFVNFNSKRLKLYDNGHLTVADAAMQAGFPNEGLFPRRGRELNFLVNGKPHMVRGELGEPAVVKLNDEEVSLNTPINAGDKIKITESVIGTDAYADIKSLAEAGKTITIIVNDKKISLPVIAQVNGELQTEYYSIKSGDKIVMLNFYTVKQLSEFMDVTINKDYNIYVNNKLASLDTLVYENFNVIWTMETLELSDVKEEEKENGENIDFSKYLMSSNDDVSDDDKDALKDSISKGNQELEERNAAAIEAQKAHARELLGDEYVDDTEKKDSAAEGSDDSDGSDDSVSGDGSDKEDYEAGESTDESSDESKIVDGDKVSETDGEAKSDGAAPEDSAQTAKVNAVEMTVFVNDEKITLKGKDSYVFVDVFNYIDFDLSKPQGRSVTTLVNGREASYTYVLNPMDKVQVYWNT